ncbi:MAG: hypothetical protein H7281_16250 [Bacteriovorax sp.]|nr:hypothetical protein [Bacteriovorax sp.]
MIYLPKFFSTKFLLENSIKTFKSAETHRLKIISHKMKKDKDQMIILGEVKNEGTDSFSSIEIDAELYDSKKELIKIESGRISGNIRPGETRHFQVINCFEKGNSKNEIDSIDTYKLIIVNGYINSKND